jgi:hypothetical protein
MIIAVALSWRKEAEVIEKVLIPTLDPESPYTSPEGMRTALNRLKARWRILRREGVAAWWRLRKHQRRLIEQAFEISKAGGVGEAVLDISTDSKRKEIDESIDKRESDPGS